MGRFDRDAIRESIRAQTGGWFALPSFLGGAGRVIDVFGVLNVYRWYASPEEADADAFRRDLAAVGSDMWAAIEVERDGIKEAAVQLSLFPQEKRTNEEKHEAEQTVRG